MSRAGTTWLSRSLNEHPSVAAFGETSFWGRSYVKPRADGAYDDELLERVAGVLKGNPLDSTIGASGPGWLKLVRTQDIPEIVDHCFSGMRTPIRPGDVFARFAQALAEREGKSCWVEKTPQHLSYLDQMLAELPKSRFVIMVRDPYGFMLSYKHQMDRGTPERRKAFERRYHPIGCAWIWRTYWRNSSRAANSYPDSVLVVHQHEIREDPKNVLRRVQEFYALDPIVDLEGMLKDVNTSFSGDHCPSLPDEDTLWMNVIAKQEVLASPFTLRPVSRRMPALAKGLLTLPAWMVRAILDIRRRGKGAHWQYLWRWMFPRFGK